MRHTETIPLVLVAVAGAAAAAQEPLKPWPVANIYYNAATGERVVTPIGAGPRRVSGPLWRNNASNCGAEVVYIDNPDFDGDTLPDFTGPGSIPSELDPPPEGAWVVDWGDIHANSVVDCVVLAYATTLPDTDTDADSIGDGIVGYDMYLTFSDADNGHDSPRYCIFDLQLTTLPGRLPSVPPGFAAFYTFTLDFASLAPSLVFELGDSDGVDDAGTGISGGALYGFPTFADLDADNRNDFSYAVRFDQSTLPLDARGLSGVWLAGPSEFAEGAEDALDLYASGPDCPPAGTADYLGTFNMGGYSCEPGAETSFASLFLELYGPACACFTCGPPGACSVADTAFPAGVLNFDDVVAFLIDFGSSGFCSDLALPLGEWNFDDVVAFMVAFGQGCP